MTDEKPPKFSTNTRVTLVQTGTKSLQTHRTKKKQTYISIGTIGVIKARRINHDHSYSYLVKFEHHGKIRHVNEDFLRKGYLRGIPITNPPPLEIHDHN